MKCLFCSYFFADRNKTSESRCATSPQREGVVNSRDDVIDQSTVQSTCVKVQCLINLCTRTHVAEEKRSKRRNRKKKDRHANMELLPIATYFFMCRYIAARIIGAEKTTSASSSRPKGDYCKERQESELAAKLLQMCRLLYTLESWLSTRWTLYRNPAFYSHLIRIR